MRVELKLARDWFTSKTLWLSVVPAVLGGVEGVVSGKLDPFHALLGICATLGLFGLRDQTARTAEAAQLQHEDRARSASQATSLLQGVVAAAKSAQAPTTVVATLDQNQADGIQQTILDAVLIQVDALVKGQLEKLLGRGFGDIVDKLVEAKLNQIVQSNLGKLIDPSHGIVQTIGREVAAQVNAATDNAVLGGPLPNPTDTGAAEPNGEA